MSTKTETPQHESAEAQALKTMRTGAYDSVASLLIALLMMVGIVVGSLFIIWLTNRLMFTQKTVPVELVEFAGRGDHAAGFARDLEPPGPEELEEEMYEPQVEATLEAVTDVVTTQTAALDAIATAAEATVKGGGGMGDSRGPGPEGEGRSDIIPPWERWEIRYTTSGLDPYARQLDYFKIELAAAGGTPLVDYAFNLAKAKPDRRTGKPEDEKRMYMSWQNTGGPLAAFDRALLGRAGIGTQRRMVLQFYPKETEMKLLRLEAENAKGRDARAFLKTIFGVRPAGSGYEFFVIDQFFRPPPTI
ncbi:MAG: hypothetical protein MUE50_17725 [Pirellulaceae bacterium]|nr:hypothetical protein [Pirellulaceae bacterium]